MRRLAAVLLLASCIGPNLVETRDDESGRHGIVSFHGRDGIGYVDARVMADRTADAVDLAKAFCDGGVDVGEKHSEGGENFIDFKCTMAPLPPAPCPEVPAKRR